MAVSFERDNAGSVMVMMIHQGPSQFECVQAGVELPVEIPGQVVYELKPPNGEGFWVFRIDTTSAVKFSGTSDGQIESIYYLFFVISRQYGKVKELKDGD